MAKNPEVGWEVFVNPQQMEREFMKPGEVMKVDHGPEGVEKGDGLVVENWVNFVKAHGLTKPNVLEGKKW